MHSDRSARSMFGISHLLQYHRVLSGVVGKCVCACACACARAVVVCMCVRAEEGEMVRA